MINILVLYDSATGNTKKMAEYVADGAAANQNVNVKLVSIDKVSKDNMVRWDCSWFSN